MNWYCCTVLTGLYCSIYGCCTFVDQPARLYLNACSFDHNSDHDHLIQSEASLTMASFHQHVLDFEKLFKAFENRKLITACTKRVTLGQQTSAT